MVSVGRLIHLNGGPGAGKTTLGQRFIDEHPLALMLEIDDLRTRLGRWSTHDETRSLARDLAIALVRCHLSSGHDVVVPQFLGRPDFIERLEATAEECGAAFIEVLVDVDETTAVDRFVRRRRELRSVSELHPEADIPDDAVEASIVDAQRLLADIARSRSTVTVVDGSGSVDETYRRMMAVLMTGMP